jgi:hypothetical protein
MGDARAITVRRPGFSFPERLDPIIVPGCPEESYTIVGLSLLLPYLEPYLIRSMNAARPRVTDPRLAAQLAAFNGQEGQHYRLHMRFNDAVRAGFTALPALEAELAADYRRFSETRSLRWNLAYAEGFEALTSAMAHFSFEEGTVRRLSPAAQALFAWHLGEELEHRTVAFDVYAHVCGGWVYRLVVGLYAQWHLNRFVRRAAQAMMDQDRADGRDHGGVREAWARVRPLLGLMVRRLVPKVLKTYLPWYTPHGIAMPAGVAELLEEATAGKMGGSGEIAGEAGVETGEMGAGEAAG